MKAVHVLLVYGLEEQKLIEVREFEKSEEAQIAYAQAERDHFLDRSVEIVLIASDSLATIRHTHASYFNEEVGVGLSERDLDRLLGV